MQAAKPLTHHLDRAFLTRLFGLGFFGVFFICEAYREVLSCEIAVGQSWIALLFSKCTFVFGASRPSCRRMEQLIDLANLVLEPCYFSFVVPIRSIHHWISKASYLDQRPIGSFND